MKCPSERAPAARRQLQNLVSWFSIVPYPVLRVTVLTALFPRKPVMISFRCFKSWTSSVMSRSKKSRAPSRATICSASMLPPRSLMTCATWASEPTSLRIETVSSNRKALLFGTRIPGEVHPALGLVVELLQRLGEDRVDGYPCPGHKDANDALTRHGARLRRNPQRGGARYATDRNGIVVAIGLAAWSLAAQFLQFRIVNSEAHGLQNIHRRELAPANRRQRILDILVPKTRDCCRYFFLDESPVQFRQHLFDDLAA